jgi:hypothetical protein
MIHLRGEHGGDQLRLDPGADELGRRLPGADRVVAADPAPGLRDPDLHVHDLGMQEQEPVGVVHKLRVLLHVHEDAFAVLVVANAQQGAGDYAQVEGAIELGVLRSTDRELDVELRLGAGFSEHLASVVQVDLDRLGHPGIAFDLGAELLPSNLPGVLLFAQAYRGDFVRGGPSLAVVGFIALGHLQMLQQFNRAGAVHPPLGPGGAQRRMLGATHLLPRERGHDALQKAGNIP